MRLSAHVLSPKSLYKLADDLREYADKMPLKIQQFLDALADRGISVASVNEGDFAGYIVYSKEFTIDGGDYVLKLVAKDRQAITNSWYSSSSPNADLRSDTFSPLLMAEFGSGVHQVPDSVGRLPDSMGHGGDPEGWYWWTDSPQYNDGEQYKSTAKNGRMLFHSKGSKPTMPMHKALMEMIDNIDVIARSVF